MLVVGKTSPYIWLLHHSKYVHTDGISYAGHFTMIPCEAAWLQYCSHTGPGSNPGLVFLPDTLLMY